MDRVGPETSALDAPGGKSRLLDHRSPGFGIGAFQDGVDAQAPGPRIAKLPGQRPLADLWSLHAAAASAEPIPGEKFAQVAAKRCRALRLMAPSTCKTMRRSRPSRSKPRHINEGATPGSSMPLRQLCAQLLVAEHPTDAACHVLQTKDVEIFPVHAGNAV